MAGEVAQQDLRGGHAPGLVTLSQISKQYPGVQALDCLSFSVARGEVHALLGANGAGKSTLIKILAGAVQRDSGDIVFDGQHLDELDPHSAAGLGVVCLFQDPALVPFLSIEQNIFLGLEDTGRYGLLRIGPQRAKARDLLQQLGLHLNPAQPVGGLRTSERQFVALARALLRNPKLLILDEPTASMTDPEIAKLFEIIRSLRDRGTSVIYVTHRLEDVFQICETVTVLRDGRHVRTCLASELSRGELVDLIAGREMRKEDRRQDYERGPVLLRARNLGCTGVFQGVSFELYRGEILALAGLVGAGRTEIARAICGADPFDEGEVTFPRKGIRVDTPADAVRAGVIMVPEDRKTQGIVPKMSVGDNLVLSSIWRLAGSLAGWIDRRKVGTIVAQHVQQLDIRPRGAEQRTIDTLSGGNQQKVLLARAMESGADVLILDEPTAGVDVGTKADIQRLVRGLTEQGKGILLVSSETDEVLALADRILVVREGRIVRELVGPKASSSSILKSALGEDSEEAAGHGA